MKIVFFGDSVTDCGRAREKERQIYNSRYGFGYVMQAAGRLFLRDPVGYEILNRGISGNRVPDLYARVKPDVWNENPDVLSILIGINDLWHGIHPINAGVELPRFEKCYRALIEETRERLPETKIMLMEPFVLRGSETEERFSEFEKVYEYAAVVKKLAEEYGLWFVPLQKELYDAAEKYGYVFLRDGVHPTVEGSALIADIWLREFDKMMAAK